VKKNLFPLSKWAVLLPRTELETEGGGKPVIKAYMFITSIAEAIVTTLYAHRLREKIFKASSGDLPDNSLHSHYHSEENLG